MPVLDASAILNAFPFHFESEIKYLTVPEVVRELKDSRSRAIAEAGVQAGILLVTSPSEEFVEKVKKIGKRFGLSITDVKALALALEKEEEIWTDDYGIQKVAKRLGVRYKPVIHSGV